jgi:hypothetical protein
VRNDRERNIKEPKGHCSRYSIPYETTNSIYALVSEMGKRDNQGIGRSKIRSEKWLLYGLDLLSLIWLFVAACMNSVMKVLSSALTYITGFIYGVRNDATKKHLEIGES